jgi:hypothetical protein
MDERCMDVERPRDVAIVLETTAYYFEQGRNSNKQWAQIAKVLRKAAIQCYKITGSICEECDVISDDIITDSLGRLICRNCAKRLGYGYCQDCGEWELLDSGWCENCLDSQATANSEGLGR